jgi:glycosyltransferase involved in cell wall biosynthesis
MKLVRRLCQQFEDLAVFIAGEPRSFYGNESPTPGVSFRDWVLSQDQYDLTRIHFLGRIPGQELPTLFDISDLHVYLTVPMVLSWSCLHAMAAGCTVLGSRTPPVMEVLTDGMHGVLANFDDVDELTMCATKILSQPLKYRYLGANARYRVLQKYSPEQTLPAFIKLAGKTARAG